MDKQTFIDMTNNASMEELEWMKDVISQTVALRKTIEQETKVDNEINVDSVDIYVDGSFNANTEEYAYGVAVLLDEPLYLRRAFPKSDASSMRNVAGEIEGAKAAIEFAVKHNIKNCRILYDYSGIEMWATDKWKANNPNTREYKAFFNANKDKCNFEFVHVKGHTGVLDNEICDALAKSALGIATAKKYDNVISKCTTVSYSQNSIPDTVEDESTIDVSPDCPFEI